MSDTRKTILNAAMVLFSEKGFDTISMRNIADAVKISPPALYNHFKDKQTLYLSVIEESFANKSEKLVAALTIKGAAIDRLENFVLTLSQILTQDPAFRRLMLREQLDGDEVRLQYLAKTLFGTVFMALMKVIVELKPDCDAHTVSVTIIGMVQKHLEMESLTQFFPNYEAQNITPENITKLVMSMLSIFFGQSYE